MICFSAPCLLLQSGDCASLCHTTPLQNTRPLPLTSVLNIMHLFVWKKNSSCYCSCKYSTQSEAGEFQLVGLLSARHVTPKEASWSWSAVKMSVLAAVLVLEQFLSSLDVVSSKNSRGVVLRITVLRGFQTEPTSSRPGL